MPLALTEADNGRTVEIELGDVLDLWLAENATTGYRWQLVRADRLSEEPVADDRQVGPPPTAPDIGAGGLRPFRFRALTPGYGRLELKFWREFEGEASVRRRFACTVNIAAAP